MNTTMDKLTGTHTYRVAFASVLTEYDREILSRLYQPLCGFGPMALYLTLWTECKYEDLNHATHKNLFNLMQCNIKEFEIFRNKLEGLGLIKTYYSEESGSYIYELYAPLSARKFFSHELLGTLLKQILDEEDYLRIKSSFIVRRDSRKNCIDLSHTFGEVYNLNLEDTYTLKSIINQKDILKDRTSASIESNFNLDLFLLALKKKRIRKDIITKELIEVMEAMINLYKLNESDLVEILQVSTDNNSLKPSVDLEKFKQKCFEYKKMPDLEPETSKKLEDKRVGIDKKIEMLDELEPFDFLRIKQGNKEPSLHDRTIIEDLSVIGKLNPGVINVLVDYVMFKQNNTIPRPYIMKIASTLIEKNIQTTKEAMQHFYRSNQYAYKLRGENVKVDKEKIINTEETVEVETPEDDKTLAEKAEKIRKLKELRREKKKNGTN